MLKLKKLLLDTGFVEDNQYLDEYVELIINNYDTAKMKNITQEHHSIPVFCYFSNNPELTSAAKRKEAVKIADRDSNNKRVHLVYSDHIKAHLLLMRCGKSYNFILSNANACMLMLDLIQAAVSEGIVANLETDENIQKAYEYWIATKVKPSDRTDYYKAVQANLAMGTPSTKRKVICVETGVVYNSIKEAEAANNLTKNRLNQVLTGRRKQTPGMTFEYYNETAEISEVSE